MLPILNLYCNLGRSNIMYVHVQNGAGLLIETRVLTCGYYYCQGKITAAVRRLNKWNSSDQLQEVKLAYWKIISSMHLWSFLKMQSTIIVPILIAFGSSRDMLRSVTSKTILAWI